MNSIIAISSGCPNHEFGSLFRIKSLKPNSQLITLFKSTIIILSLVWNKSESDAIWVVLMWLSVYSAEWMYMSGVIY